MDFACVFNKIEINEESLQAWNNQRANNKVFKEPITDPSKTGAKLQYWHTLPKPNKYLYASLSALMMLLMLLSLIGATVRTATKGAAKSGGGGGGGGKTNHLVYEGYWPEASYVVVFDKWTQYLQYTHELIAHTDTFNPNGNCLFGIMAAFPYDPLQNGEFEEYKSQAVSQGYQLIDTGVTQVHDNQGQLIDELPYARYEMEYGPETTWHYHKYWAQLKISAQLYSSYYEAYQVWTEYSFTVFSD